MVFKLRDLLACVVVSKTTCYSSNCSWSTEKSLQSQKRLFSEAHFLYLNQLQQSQGENNPIQLINKHNLNTFTMISHQLFFYKPRVDGSIPDKACHAVTISRLLSP